MVFITEVPQSSGDTSVFTRVYSNSALYTGDTDFYSSATAITNREYEEKEQDKKKKNTSTRPQIRWSVCRRVYIFDGREYNIMRLNGIQFVVNMKYHI